MGSRLRITADIFASGGFDTGITPKCRSLSYMANEHLPWFDTFQSNKELPSLAWHTRDAEDTELLQAQDVILQQRNAVAV